MESRECENDNVVALTTAGGGGGPSRKNDENRLLLDVGLRVRVQVQV